MTRNRHFVRGLGFGLWLTALGVASIASAQPVKIYPTTGAGGAYTIAVLSDGFDDQTTFETIAKDLFVSGLFADSYYSSKGSAFTVSTVFVKVPAGQTSNYNFTLNAGVTNCDVSWDDSGGSTDTSVMIEKALQNVPHRRVLVIGNVDYHFGCTYGNWTYVARKAQTYLTLEHEFGHLIAGLLDENFPLPPPQTPAPATLHVSGPNCSTVQPPLWTGTPGASGATNPNGCDQFSQGIVRAFDTCRMGKLQKPFCSVCSGNMDSRLGAFGPQLAPKAPTNLKIIGAGFFFQPPPAPPSFDDRSVRVLVRINARTGATSVLNAADEVGPPIAEHGRSGDYVYEISDGDATVETGVLAGNPFETRSYRGTTVPHATNAVDAAPVIVFIPRATRQSLLTRNVAVTFYRVGPLAVGRLDITPAYLRSLKAAGQVTQVAIVRSEDLKKALR